MKYFFIFALFLIACSDVNERCPTFEVTISDALPIQFWLADCETYNEKEVCGVHHKCWCHPWNCDDELTIQFTDTAVSEYVLRVFNSDNEVIEEIPFDTTQFTEDPFADTPFSEWTNVISGGSAWSISSTPSVSVNNSGGATSKISDYLRRPMVLPPGTYTITYDISSLVTSTLWLRFRKDGVNVGSASLNFISPDQGSVNITLTEESDEFIVYLSVPAFSTGSVTIDELFQSLRILRDPVYTASFVPSDFSICNQQVYFKIVEVGISPENEIAKSDCINIMPDHNCTTLIEYSNNRNFAGLVYEDVSPAQSFKTRVPAIFFHERFPEEDNVIELSESIVHTSGQVKAQRLFDTDYMPYYMHRKLQLIFKQQNIFIENQYWTKEEPYEVQDGERRWPAKKAKCFLTEKNYVQRAVL